ncbi:MAG TPA: glycosyltransferase, partial [Chloroflexota bacterium]|nr:glycosyltransferase [Chloroflexota bacterium]
LTLLRHLSSDRYDRWLAYFEERPDAADVMVDDFRAAGVTTVDLAAHGRNDPGAWWRLGSLMRRESFDIVHVHSLRAEICAAFWASSVTPRPRLIRSIHNTDALYDHPVLRRLGAWSASKMDRIISISDAVTEFARAHLGPTAAPVERIYYGLDPDQYRRDRSRQPGTMKVAIVARLAAQKGHHVLLDAIQEVARSIPSVHLLVIGHEDDLTMAELQGYADQLRIKDNVSFLGFRADIAELIEDADLFVLPSLWEGFGLVLIEAMALGLPVVASSVGPIPEIVLDGQSGRLVPPGNAPALADAIRGLLESPDTAFAMGHAGRERVKAAFGVQKMVGAIERVYAELSPSLPQARVA